MLRSVKFRTNYRCFKEGTEFTFKPKLNLVVGDNGCGKSTLLKLLAENNTDILDIDADLTESYFLDLEHNNPRTASYIEHIYQAASKFSSHGESNNALLNTVNRIPDNTVTLIDEPDMSLSIRSINKLYKTLKKNSKNKQIICSVHNLLLISSVDEVLSLEHSKWMSSQEFITLSKES